LASRAASAIFIPSFLNSLASDALNPGPAPTINAISCCAMNPPAPGSNLYEQAKKVKAVNERLP
jgi:hypothetical protein